MASQRWQGLATILPDANSGPPSRTWSPGHPEEEEQWPETRCDLRHICVCVVCVMCCVCYVCMCVVHACMLCLVWYTHTEILEHNAVNLEIKQSSSLSLQSREFFFLFWVLEPFVVMERQTDQNGFEGTTWKNKGGVICALTGKNSMAPATNTNAAPSTQNPPLVLQSEIYLLSGNGKDKVTAILNNPKP